MPRSLAPFMLVILGFTLVLWGQDLPLFEWKIYEIVADIPPEFHFKTSPWITRLGESVEGPSFGDHYVFWQAYIPAESFGSCSPADLHPVVQRSWFDESLDRLSLNFYQKVIPWFSHPLMVGLLLFLSGMYIWWFASQHKYPASGAIICGVIALVVFCVLLVNVWHPLSGRVVPGWPCSDSYDGTVTFSAQLSKVHYETLMVLFAGIFAELGAIGVMAWQIGKAVSKRKESSKSAVG